MELSLFEQCAVLSPGFSLPSGTGMIFSFSDILNRPRHKRNAQSKNNVFVLVECMDTNPLQKLRSRDNAHK